MAESNSILSSVSCNLDRHLLQASFPLFEAGEVQAIEWSFDALHDMNEIPSWFTGLLKEFAAAGRLIGHGVYYSLFSGRWLPEQENWLKELEVRSREFRFAQVTEHFGFMSGPDFHKGAPLAVPLTDETLAVGRDRLMRLAQACRCPVGLENLAFAWSREEAQKHGQFLKDLLSPVNGFLILDLHNLYCHLTNFELEYEDAIASYPLDRVREIHISGGSWADSMGNRVRRDTHDDAVPEAVFGLLESTLPRCPNLKYVVLEQMGIALETKEKQAQFQADFRQMDRLVTACNEAYPDRQPDPFHAPSFLIGPTPPEFPELYQQQKELSRILVSADGPAKALKNLRESDLAQSGWDFESWSPSMLETAMQIAQKWSDGFN